MLETTSPLDDRVLGKTDAPMTLNEYGWHRQGARHRCGAGTCGCCCLQQQGHRCGGLQCAALLLRTTVLGFTGVRMGATFQVTISALRLLKPKF